MPDEQQVRRPRVTRGLRRGPERIIIYGPEGVGKTKFGAEAPKPIFLDLENSTTRLDVARIGDWDDPDNLPPQDYEQLTNTLWLLVTDKEFRGDAQTLVIDTADKLEQSFIHPETLRRWPIEEGKSRPQQLDEIGFNKGYTAAMKVWEEFLGLLDSIQTHTGMNIIIVAHARISKVENLNGVDYSCYEPDLYVSKNASAAARLREWASEVFFMTFKDAAVAQKAREVAAGKAPKMITTGRRVIWTTHQAWCEAKNRSGLPNEVDLPEGSAWQTYDTLVDAYYARHFNLTSASDDSIRKMILHYARRIASWPETPFNWLDGTFMPQLTKVTDREGLLKFYPLIVAKINNRAKRLLTIPDAEKTSTPDTKPSTSTPTETKPSSEKPPESAEEAQEPAQNTSQNTNQTSQEAAS